MHNNQENSLKDLFPTPHISLECNKILIFVKKFQRLWNFYHPIWQKWFFYQICFCLLCDPSMSIILGAPKLWVLRSSRPRGTTEGWLMVLTHFSEHFALLQRISGQFGRGCTEHLQIKSIWSATFSRDDGSAILSWSGSLIDINHLLDYFPSILITPSNETTSIKPCTFLEIQISLIGLVLIFTIVLCAVNFSPCS